MSKAKAGLKVRLGVLAAGLILTSLLVAIDVEPAGAATTGAGTSTLIQGQALAGGQALYSPDRRFQFIMQTDGNLVLYGPSGVLWSSRSQGNPGAYAILQTDGNLVVNNSVRALFASGTAGPDYLTVQSDGNVVLNGPTRALWATNTAQPPPLTAVAKGSAALGSNVVLAEGNYLSAADGRFTLIDQTDGNIVLYERGVPLFATNTFSPGDYLVMQADGNLVVNGPTRALWSSGTGGNPGAYAILQGDGNLVVYGPSRALWSSRTSQPTSGVGVYGGYGSTAQAATAIGGGWPVIGDAGALGTPGPPYTGELPSEPDANVGSAIAAAGSATTWLSFWTVSGPVAGDSYNHAGDLAGINAASTLDALGVKPSFVILDPEGYNTEPTSPAAWLQFLSGWATGIRSVNAGLTPAFYANQSQYQSGDLASIVLPSFIAVSPVLFSSGSANPPFVSGPNIEGFIEYYGGCPAAPYVAAVSRWGAPYNTVQFPDSAVDCGA